MECRTNNYKDDKCDNNIRLAEEKDFKAIIDFLKENNPVKGYTANANLKLVYINPLLSQKSYFKELVIRNNLYNYKEEFVLYEEDKNIRGIVAFNVPQLGKQRTLPISCFIIPDDEDLISDIFEFAVRELSVNAIIEPTKIRILIVDSIKEREKLVDILENCKFQYELTLKNELGIEKNALSYVRYIPKNEGKKSSLAVEGEV